MTIEKAKIPLLEAAKWLTVLLVILFLALQLSSGRESNTDFQDMVSAVTAAADLTPMQEGDNQMIRRLYGIDPANYEGACLYYPTTNMGAEEILLIKLSAKDQADAVSDAIQNRVATQMASFDGYGFAQYEMLEKSITEVQGNYVLLVVAEDPGAVRQAFMNAL